MGKSRGRQPKEGGPDFPVTGIVRLTREQKELAIRIGHGSFSDGIRQALSQYAETRKITCAVNSARDALEL